MLPTGRYPGGAPCSVALHLHQLGRPVRLISRVGDDDLGREILAFLVARGLDPALIQRSTSHLTGMAKVNIRAAEQPVYKIAQPHAWDYIQYNEEIRLATVQAQMLVYGTLAARCLVSRETLYRLLQHANFKVLDLNLRAPHYSREVVKYLLRQADLVKLNESELVEILAWHGQSTAVETALPWLAEQFGLQAICLTRATGGASLYAGSTWWHCPGFTIKVENSIGCGDAFLAALLAGWATDLAPGECLRQACAASALVASHRGANPPFTQQELGVLLDAAWIGN